MKAVDNAGNETETEEIEKITEEVPGLIKDTNLTFRYNPTGWTNGNVTVTIESNVTGYTLQYSTDGSNWYDYEGSGTMTQNGAIYARLRDSTGQIGGVATGNVANIDKVAPKEFTAEATATTNSITVSGSTSDVAKTNTNGCSGIARYEYSINNGAWQASNVFSNLTQNTTYTIKMKAIDNAGNEVITNGVQKITSGVPTLSGNVTFSYNPTGWTNGNVTVTINTNVTGYTLQYSIDGNNWHDYGGSGTMTQNGAIYARLRDSTGQIGGTATGNVSNIDKVAPNNFTPTATATTNSITVSGSTSDVAKTNTNGCSGIARYEYSINNGAWQSSNVFTNLRQNTRYTIKMRAIDNAGNERVTSEIEKTTSGVPTLNGNVTFSYSPSGWTRDNVAVTITSNVSGYTLQYSTDGTNWYNYAGGVTMTQNGAIYARLRDSTGQIGGNGTGNVWNIDRTPPRTFTAYAKCTNINRNTVTIEVTGSTIDDASGMGSYTLNLAGNSYNSLSVNNVIYSPIGDIPIEVIATDNVGNTRKATVIKRGWWGYTGTFDYCHYDNNGEKNKGDYSETKRRTNKYYFKNDGNMYLGWRKNSDGKWIYYIENYQSNANTIAVMDANQAQELFDTYGYERGSQLEKEGKYEIRKAEEQILQSFYFNADGTMFTGWKQIDGKYYYFQTLQDDSSNEGAMAKSKWIKSNNKWYYLKGSGVMAESEWFEETPGVWYYLKPGGAMCQNESYAIKKANGTTVTYKFDSSGHCLNPND